MRLEERQFQIQIKFRQSAYCTQIIANAKTCICQQQTCISTKKQAEASIPSSLHPYGPLRSGP